MSDRLEQLVASWARLGAGFNAASAAKTPDLERLLLETARESSKMARVFIMAATWLHRYGDLVARHRLKRLIREELERDFHATLGLLLDLAQQGTHPLQFASIIRELSPADPPRPLLDVERTSTHLAQRAMRRASDVSRRWGLWCEDFEFKGDVLRPAAWLMHHSPGVITRADFRGDL